MNFKIESTGRNRYHNKDEVGSEILLESSSNLMNLYLETFKILPNRFIIYSKNEVFEEFETKYKEEIKNSVIVEAPSEIISKIFNLDEILISFTSYGYTELLYNSNECKLLKSIKDYLLNNKGEKEKVENQLLLITQEGPSLGTSSFKIKDSDCNIDDNYNDDFKETDTLILDKLSNSDKGVILLHGIPGTGKTSYLRCLIKRIEDKKLLFLPPNLAYNLTDPSFLTFLTRYSNSILIIEDAENIIADRNNNKSSTVSNLLNITDGLLSDILNIQIICTFNCDLSKIDSALLRKGRLIAKYEFGKLSVDKSNNLAKKLNKNIIFSEPQTLTEIYNSEEKTVNNVDRPIIGFNRS